MFLVDQLKKDLASAHVRQQAARVLRLFALAEVSQLAALGTAHLDRTALISATIGAAEAVYRQFSPVVPWVKLAERLHLLGLVQQASTTSVAAVPPVTSVAPPAAPDGSVGV